MPSGANWQCGPATRARACAGQFFAPREELALRSGSGLPLYCCTMPVRAAFPGSLQDGEGAGLLGLPRHADADRPGCPDHAAGTSTAPREVRGSSLFAEFGPFRGQTRAREVLFAPDRDGCRLGAARMRSDAEWAGRPSTARGERAMPSSDDEWLRAAASAATVAALEVELDDERERYFEGNAADSEHERDAHDARLIELHRAACLRRTSGPAFKHQVGSGNALTTIEGLADAAAALYQCRRPGCLALVDAGRARAAACRRPDRLFRAGDGCAGPRCAARWRRDRFVPRQCHLARSLFQGGRRLADWPTRVGGGPGARRSRASGARAAFTALAWLQVLGLCSFEGSPPSPSSAP